MSSQSVTVGIDKRGSVYYVVTISRATGRLEIKSLASFEKKQIEKQSRPEAEKIVSSIPDESVNLKSIILPENISDIKTHINFELSQSTLEDEELYSFDYVETVIESRYLGLILRKENLADNFSIMNDINPDTKQLGMLRSVGLAKGYLNFCTISESELICLADINENILSIAFLYKNKILDLSYIRLEENIENENEKLTKAAVELKTIVNFKMSEFFELGISVPLSALYLSGDITKKQVNGIFDRYFEHKIRKPHLLPQYFNELKEYKNVPIRKYLVALGLAVN